MTITIIKQYTFKNGSIKTITQDDYDEYFDTVYRVLMKDSANVILCDQTFVYLKSACKLYDSMAINYNREKSNSLNERIIMTIITNNIARPILHSYELPIEALKEFDYYDTEQLEQASFFKYKCSYYDLGNFIRIDTDNPDFRNWHGAQGDSWFSGTLVRFTNDNESVIVGRYYN